MNRFSALGCSALTPRLANLATLIAQAEANGVGTWPAIESARAVYNDLIGYQYGVYIPFLGNDCERHIAEVRAAEEKVKIVLNSMDASTWVPRPDAELIAPEAYGLPTWTKWAVFGVLGVVALHYITPLVPRRRLSGGRR